MPKISAAQGPSYGEPRETDPVDVADTKDAEPSTDDALPFDPSELTVDEVNDLLADASDEDVEAVMAAERAGRNRKGIVGE